MGRAWIDHPYILQQNFGAGPSDPLYMIRTAIADTDNDSDPMVTFNINRCARVTVYFPDDFGTAPPYPGWIAQDGYECSIPDENSGGTVSTWYHETLGSADQISGPYCSRLFAAGQVRLGPRQPSDPDSIMYAIFVKAPFSFDALDCP